MKRTYLLFMCVLASLVMTAAQLTKDQAKQAAEQFLKQKVSKVATVKATQVVPIRQAQASAHDNSSKTTAYAVNLGKNDGFVLVVGNDNSNDVIGYCDHGQFNAHKMPSNMRSWLESYMACAGDDVNATSSTPPAKMGSWCLRYCWEYRQEWLVLPLWATCGNTSLEPLP